jgi:hypothetical protein
MARSLFLTFAAASIALAAAATPVWAQTTVTTTTTTKTLGGITSQTTVTEETSVIGEPTKPVAPAAGTTGAGVPTTGVPATGVPATGVPATGAPSAQDEVMTKAGIRDACTGVAKDSREDPRWRDFAAKLVFTVEGGGFLPDVLTRIEDRQGNEVFTARCDGPWLLLDLPADSYRVVATAEDPRGEIHQRTADISVGAQGQSETIIRFDDIPG